MSLADQMLNDATEGQRIARKHFVIGLDFSMAGLSELDEAAGNVDVFLRGGASPENVAMLTKTWGAYLGEVIRRDADAEWVESDNEHQALLKTASGELVSPHEQIRQRLTEGAAHDLAGFAERAK